MMPCIFAVFFRAVLCLFTRTKCKHRKMLECIIIRLTLIDNHNLWTNWVDDAAAVVGIWINYNWLNILEKCILTQCVIVMLEKGNDRHCGPESFAFPLTLSPIISTHLANWKIHPNTQKVSSASTVNRHRRNGKRHKTEQNKIWSMLSAYIIFYHLINWTKKASICSAAPTSIPVTYLVANFHLCLHPHSIYWTLFSPLLLII